MALRPKYVLELVSVSLVEMVENDFDLLFEYVNGIEKVSQKQFEEAWKTIREELMRRR